MFYPEEFESKIGFSQIRELVKAACVSVLGREEVDRISFSADHETVTTLLAQTEEFRQILLSGEPFPSQDYFNTIPLLSHLRIENTWPEPEQLAELRAALNTFLEIIRFFNDERFESYPKIASLIQEVRETGGQEDRQPASGIWYPVSDIRDQIDNTLDSKANIRDGASKELTRIRREINRLQTGVERKMAQVFSEVRRNGWTDEEAEVTVRDGRLVIPMRSSHKRKINGVVHDESATGLTVFVEPMELFEMNNEIRELFYAEKREIIRILTALADTIRPHIDLLIRANELLGEIDCIRAKALFAMDTGAMLCNRVAEGPHLNWEQAVHPLLLLSHRKAKKKVVPLFIELNPEQRVLVISGPNAGGKSIGLKTIGLLQYMLQCGLLPATRKDSEFGIFREIMIDIGDEQSLENDLSTYTSKLLNMKYFIEHLGQESLFLMDELGTGTDPSVGGAIAEAALEHMVLTRAYGVVTTHYSNLKLLAGKVEGVVNGAMLYDSKGMRPLYKLKTGKPGSSFALEIAQSIGFPEKELRRASELIGGSQLNFDRQLQDLELEKEEVQKRSTELQVADEFLSELIEKYQQLTEELERSKKNILEKAHEEAQQMLKDSNKLIERVIKEIRESQADKERTKKAREAIAPGAPKSPEGDLLPPLGLPPNPLKGASSLPFRGGVGRGESGVSKIISEKQEHFTLTLDLRGKRADEAFVELQRYIDDAVLLSIKEVRILHGKGTGALKEVTREYLRSVKEVKRYRDEHIEQGGAGITVVEFN
ncbi:MAG: Smr/MutS family protein [bacterium]